MPYKNREDKLAAQRRSYAKHRKEVIAAVNARKWNLYGGTCIVCGGPTQGSTKNVPPPQYCSKPACRSEQRNPWKALQRERQLTINWKHDLVTTRNHHGWRGACVCGWETKHRHGDIAKVEAAYKKHTKLVERERTASGEAIPERRTK